MKFWNTCKRLLLLVFIVSLLVGCENIGSVKSNESIIEQTSINISDCEIVYLNILEDNYYPILLPKDIQYSTDNSKYIYNEDESMSITVVSDADMYNFSESVYLNNAENIEQYLIATAGYNNVDVKEAALYLTGDKAIRVRVDGDTELFETILYGLRYQDMKSFANSILNISEELLQSTSIPVYEGDILVSAGLGEDLRKSYVFDDGHLHISREFRKYQEAQELYKQRLSVVAESTNADYFYCDDRYMYLEIDDYVVAVYHVNFNTVLTCIGKGDTAKCNATFFLQNQE